MNFTCVLWAEGKPHYSVAEGRLGKIQEIAHNLAKLSSGFQSQKVNAIHVLSSMQVLFTLMEKGKRIIKIRQAARAL